MTEYEEMPPDKELKMDILWKYYEHADNLHSNRMNFFLVVETVLVAVFFQQEVKMGPKIVLFMVGIVATFIWGYVNWRLQQRMDELTPILKHQPEYRRYIEAAPEGLSSGALLTRVLPTMFLVGWLMLIILAACGNLT